METQIKKTLKYLPAVLIVFFCVPTFGDVIVKVGDTKKEVLGRNPYVVGSGMMQGKEVLIYSDARVFLENGIVVSFDGNAGSTQFLKRVAKQKEADEQKRKAFQQEQLSRGLILYQGAWMTPEEREKIELSKKKAQNEKIAKRRTELLDKKKELLKLCKTILMSVYLQTLKCRR